MPTETSLALASQFRCAIRCAYTPFLRFSSTTSPSELTTSLCEGTNWSPPICVTVPNGSRSDDFGSLAPQLVSGSAMARTITFSATSLPASRNESNLIVSCDSFCLAYGVLSCTNPACRNHMPDDIRTCRNHFARRQRSDLRRPCMDGVSSPRFVRAYRLRKYNRQSSLHGG